MAFKVIPHKRGQCNAAHGGQSSTAQEWRCQAKLVRKLYSAQRGAK
jgi:hypothetical protein